MDVQSAPGIDTLMRIVFRTDASIVIGTGHVMRCLTLADVLREFGASCIFICREHPGHLLDLIRQRGYEAWPLPAGEGHFQKAGKSAHAGWLGTDWQTDADQTYEMLGQQAVEWLVVDHYALDIEWESRLRPRCRNLMVIDDLADRPHDCDLLLDQNLGRREQDYCDLLTPSAHCLIGPQFALLRPDFAQWRERSLAQRVTQKPKSLLISMGGTDHSNVTGKVLNCLRTCDLPSALTITVVMGPHAPWLAQVRTQAAEMPWSTRVLTGVSNMAQLMAASDLAIGAAGGTAWERCALGVPALLLVLAENQKAGAEALQKAGAAVVVQKVDDIGDALVRIIGSGTPNVLRRLSQSAASLVDGGGAARVRQRMIDHHV